MRKSSSRKRNLLGSMASHTRFLISCQEPKTPGLNILLPTNRSRSHPPAPSPKFAPSLPSARSLGTTCSLPTRPLLCTTPSFISPQETTTAFTRPPTGSSRADATLQENYSAFHPICSARYLASLPSTSVSSSLVAGAGAFSATSPWAPPTSAPSRSTLTASSAPTAF